MRTGDLTRAMRHIRKAAFLESGQSMTNGQLLDSFLICGEEAAFEALVNRHGPMVFGVCQRVLRNSHDAEDAFQATFLVLIRKANSIAPREMVGNWLYGVAYRTALEARATGLKRTAKEREMREMAHTYEPPDNFRSELHSLLDRELTGLPKKYRVPIVLCDLEGKTRKEAAGLLKLPEGTLSTRLARGRALLAKRLACRGVALSGGSLAVALGQNAASASVPTWLVQATVKTAALVAAGQVLSAGMISPPVIALMKGVMKTMLLTKLKVATVFVLAIGLIGTANMAVYRSLAAAPVQVTEKERQELAANNGNATPIADEKGKKETQEENKRSEAEKEAKQGTKDAKPHGFPKGPAPTWVCASIDKEGKFVVEVPVVSYKTETTKIKKDGEEKEAFYYEPVVAAAAKRFEENEVRVFDVAGKPIDMKEVKKLLVKKTLALASMDRRKVDPFYLRIIKEGTLVLVVSKPLWDTPQTSYYAPSTPEGTTIPP